MLFSRNWLADYLDLPSDQELARRLTFAGLAVEGREPRGDDLLLDLDVTTNRPDAMSHFGLAREVAVLTGAELRGPETGAEEIGEPTSEAVRVTLEDEEGCPRYVARLVRGVRVGESPAWLKERLEALGLRPINNVVDVTNFVLWETGQPLHGFDLAKLEGPEIRVRRARQGEKLVTLDEEERQLTPEMLVIADAERPVALAGVMGGLDSEVTSSTRDVLIESAHFQPRRVRLTAKGLGIKTDASHRFERGADPEACRWAADRAARLIAEVAGGEILQGAVDARGEMPERRRGRLDLGRLQAFAGLEIEAGEVERILRGLGFEIQRRDTRRDAVASSTAESGDGISWDVGVPSWRTYDFEPRPEPSGEVYPADLYEEVLRVHGFEAVPSTLPSLAGSDAPQTEAQRRRELIRDHLAGCGYAEAINYAFHAGAVEGEYPSLLATGEPISLVNPLSERFDVLRRSLVPNLVDSARYNRRRGAGSVAQFEIGHVFCQGEGAGEVEEREAVALVLGGRRGTPWDRPVDLDLFDLKGAVESLGRALKAEIEARPAELPGLVSGTGAELWLGGERAGFLGRVDEEADEYPLFVAELATAAFATVPGHEDLTIQVPSRYPGVAADLTLTHSAEVPWAELERAVEENRPEDLVGFGLKDRYEGEGVPEGAVNTTLWFLYNSPQRSLTQEEVNERQSGLAEIFEDRFGWEG